MRDLVYRQLFCFHESDFACVVDDFIADEIVQFVLDVADVVVQR
jgi:hypothetical protein